jgi:hypothetical protein
LPAVALSPYSRSLRRLKGRVMAAVRVCVLVGMGIGLAGCVTSSAGFQGVPLPGGSSSGVFAGTHIRYDSTIKPGKLYRTAAARNLEFGSELKPLCPTDFEHIKIQTGAPANKQDYTDELSGKITASASGIQWVSALFSLSGGAEASVSADFKNIYSLDATNLLEIDGKLGSGCRKLIQDWKGKGHAVFLVERAFQTDDTVTLKASTKANASVGVGQLKFIKVGPSGSIEGGRNQTRVFRGTVVEVVPFVKD